MKNHMRHKNYFGSVNYNDIDEVFYGKVEGIRSLISYEGIDVKSLKKAFVESLEDYLETCKENNMEAEKPFKGSFNVRVGNKLHRKAQEYAWNNDTNINTIAKEALEAYFQTHQL